MHLLLFVIAPPSPARHSPQHRRLRRAIADPASSLSLMSIPSYSTSFTLLTSLTSTSTSTSTSASASTFSSTSFPVSSSSADYPEFTLTSSSTFLPTPPTASTLAYVPAPPSSITPLPSTSSSSASASLPTPSSSTASTPVAVEQSQPSSTSVPSLDGAGTSTQDISSSPIVSTSTPPTPSPTAARGASSGFFANAGAVGGTFTVVGLVSIACVIAIALLILRRRHSRSHDEDTEFLDKSLNLSPDPPIHQVSHLDDNSISDHAHYGAPPMALATPAALYYPDHAYALHPQAFLPESYPPLHDHPVPATQDYTMQRVYSQEDYDIAHPLPVARVDANKPNPRELTEVELGSALAPPAQPSLPDTLRPSVKSTSAAPKQWAGARFSADSFYTGITTDTLPSPGRAL